jgi:TRAP-type C4-dicarboxylate transport system substrate-binding protein
LGWYDGGSRSFYCTNKRLTGPRDFKGLRIRVQGTEVFKEMINLLGATPMSVPYKEVKTAFEEGKIDCAENNLPSFVSAGHYKNARYFFQTEHVITPEALVISGSAWKKLSAADQKLLQEAGERSAKLMRQLWLKQVDEARAIATKAGVVFERPIEFGAYVSRMKPLHQKYWLDTATRDELITILAN